MNDESDFEIWSWNLSRAHCAVEVWENKLRFNLNRRMNLIFSMRCLFFINKKRSYDTEECNQNGCDRDAKKWDKKKRRD